MRSFLPIEDFNWISSLWTKSKYWQDIKSCPLFQKRPPQRFTSMIRASQILSPDCFYAHPNYPMDSYLCWTGSGSCSGGWSKGLVCTQEGVKNPFYRRVRI